MRLIIIGAGGYGRTVLDVAEQSGKYEKILFLDDNAKDENVVGKCCDFESYIDENTELYPAFGNNEARLAFIEKLEQKGADIAVIIHSSAYVSPKAIIQKGCVILPGAVINTGTVVEKGCIINCGAIIDHGCVIGKGAHICLGAVVKADNAIPSCMKIEAGEVIENRTYLLNGDK